MISELVTMVTALRVKGRVVRWIWHGCSAAECCPPRRRHTWRSVLLRGRVGRVPWGLRLRKDRRRRRREGVNRLDTPCGSFPHDGVSPRGVGMLSRTAGKERAWSRCVSVSEWSGWMIGWRPCYSACRRRASRLEVEGKVLKANCINVGWITWKHAACIVSNKHFEKI